MYGHYERLLDSWFASDHQQQLHCINSAMMHWLGDSLHAAATGGEIGESGNQGQLFMRRAWEM